MSLCSTLLLTPKLRTFCLVLVGATVGILTCVDRVKADPLTHPKCWAPAEDVGRTCPSEVCDTLAEARKAACQPLQEKRGCKGNDLCPVLREKISYVRACIEARILLTRTCFSSGNEPQHDQIVANLIEHLAKCYGFLQTCSEGPCAGKDGSGP